MNRGNLYLLLWLGAFCFLLYHQVAMRTRMMDPNQVRTPINKANWAHPKADDIFMIQDTSGLVKYLKIVENRGEDSLLIHKGLFTFHVAIKGKSIYDKRWNYDFMRAEEMYLDSLSYLSFSALTKEKEAAHITKSFRELPKRKQKTAIDFLYLPLFTILVLVVFGLIILLFNFINSRLNEKADSRRWKLGLFMGFSALTSFIAYRSLNFLHGLIESELTIVKTIYFVQTLIIFFLGLIIFSLLKKQIAKLSSFSDRELLKFVSILFGGFFLTMLTAFSSYKLNLHFGVHLGFSHFNWRLLAVPYGPEKWFLFASANLIVNFRKHFLQLRKEGRVVKLAQKRELESKAELDGLQASVNPHFLYNSLNSIASLAQEDPAKTEEMAIALSTFYKYNTNRKEERWATISDEIEMLRSYLDIEKIRFGDRLQTKLEVEEACEAILIPRFLLQPLVENAIKYGYNSEANKTSVSVIVKSDNKLLTFSIIDEGPPFSESLNDGYGLRMVQKKLRLLLPNRHRIEFLNEPTKEVRISIEL